MMTGTILAMLALAQLILGLRFIFGYQRNQTLVWYGLFMIGSVIYVGANAFGFLDWGIQPELAEHLAWTGGIIATAFFLPFTFSFPLPTRSARELLPLSLWPLLVFVPAILFTDLLIQHQGIVRFGQGYTTATGPYFWTYPVFMAIYWIWGVANLVRRLKASDGVHRWQLRTLLTGVVSSLVISSFFDIYMPISHVTKFGWVGSMFTAIWFGYTGYILLKK